MANHKSAKKRALQNKDRALQNKVKRTISRTSTAKVVKAIDSKDGKSAAELLIVAQADLAKAAKTGAIAKNAAARKTSRLAKRLNQLAK